MIDLLGIRRNNTPKMTPSQKLAKLSSKRIIFSDMPVEDKGRRRKCENQIGLEKGISGKNPILSQAGSFATFKVRKISQANPLLSKEDSSKNILRGKM